MKRIATVASFTLLAGCPTAAPRNRVEVAPGIYEDTLLSELSEPQQEAVCIALRDSCFVATPAEEPFTCATGTSSCGRYPATFVNDEHPNTCLGIMRGLIADNTRNDCNTDTVGQWMQCDRDRWQQCQTAPGEWNLPSCLPLRCN